MYRILLSPILLLAIVAGFFAGCYSSERRERRGDLESMAERAKDAPPVFVGEQLFFDGKVKVIASVSRGFAGGPGGPGGERRPAGHFGMGHRRDQDSDAPEDEGDGYEPPRMVAGESHLPPMMIHLKFENLTDAPLTVGIFDFTSALGDFAVQPDKLTIPAHGSAEPDAMTSRLGLDGGDVSMKLILHMNGQRDEQKIVLHAEPPPEKRE